MKVVFAGTSEFARQAYIAICEADFDVPLVLTQPDRRAGRGMKLMASAVKTEALERGAQVAQPISLRLDGKYSQEAQLAKQLLEELKPDVMVVAAYGLILPQWVLDLPQYGCLNIHASLLPRWRGAAPIQRAIEAGDKQTGVDIMQMDAGLDTGDILLEASLAIENMNAGQLHDRLAELGSQSIVEVLKQLGNDTLSARKQATTGICYAEKIQKEEANLDWHQPAEILLRKIRAFNPFPGVNLSLSGCDQAIKVWQAQALVGQAHIADPGKILDASAQGIDVATSDGAIRITELQKPGGKRQTAAQFIQHWTY